MINRDSTGCQHSAKYNYFWRASYRFKTTQEGVQFSFNFHCFLKHLNSKYLGGSHDFPYNKPPFIRRKTPFKKKNQERVILTHPNTSIRWAPVSEYLRINKSANYGRKADSAKCLTDTLSANDVLALRSLSQDLFHLSGFPQSPTGRGFLRHREDCTGHWSRCESSWRRDPSINQFHLGRVEV